ncbi:MAG TPA: GH116 family glycosyl hydrolase [Candidatus Acidoferrales bacterium]|nr:GH116 family glycosyl hydrolase [Candidatus Acidoferrales bacterium]
MKFGSRANRAPLAPHDTSVVDRRFAYVLSDDQIAQGSTLGAPRCCVIVKPTGAVERIFCPDAGFAFFGSINIRLWDRRSGVRLASHDGEFHFHPERQDHIYELDNGVHVHEQIFPYNYDGEDGTFIPPATVYYRFHFRNDADHPVSFDAYGFCELRGDTAHDVVAEFDRELGGIVAWNKGAPSGIRLFATLTSVQSWETTDDRGKMVSRTAPAALANAATATGTDPVGALHVEIDLDPGEDRWVEFLCVLSANGREELAAARRASPPGKTAVARTTTYYWKYLQRSVILTPDRDVNQGVLWAKANMLRVQTYAPTGWCFTNDPTRSNNSVGRDTAWMAVGADYLNPAFSLDSLQAYFRLQQSSGKIIEYYDVRNGVSEDYGLNVNDNTPLVVIALAHHYAVTGNQDFVRTCYPCAVRAMDYMLSQRNEQGLIWCSSTKNANWGIVGWRNVIRGYRISGASTEVNSECYAALRALVEMARLCGDEAAMSRYGRAAEALREAINTHLVNPLNDLYYLTIDVDGAFRTDITSDLLFPVLFGVAPPERAARIIGALSDAAFWTDAGMRTVPRDDLIYGPTNGYGLLGGVWVAVTFWYARAAAKYSPTLMAKALAMSFRHFSRDPRRNDTVPGQFSEWLHGEILVNQGMMLSPWDAPRYLWAAIEGAAGLEVHWNEAKINPALAAEWRWLIAVNVPYRGASIAWIAARMPEGLHVFTTSKLGSASALSTYERDVTAQVRVTDANAALVAFANDERTLIFVGNSGARAVTTAVSLKISATTSRVRVFSTVWNAWQDLGDLRAPAIEDGIVLIVDAGGFALVELG